MKHPEIVLKGIQIKSLEKARILAKALNTIEEECGIREVKITCKNIFICPWINLDKLRKTEMECLLRDLFKQLV